jgi:hypothetical protein
MAFKRKNATPKKIHFKQRVLKPRKRRKYRRIFLIKTILKNLIKLGGRSHVSGFLTSLFYPGAGLYPYSYLSRRRRSKFFTRILNFYQTTPNFNTPTLGLALALPTIKKNYLSNYNPVFCLPRSIKLSFLRRTTLNKNVTSTRYLNFYLNGFISHLIQLKSLVILQTNLNTFCKNFTTSFVSLNTQLGFYFSKVHVKFFRKFPLRNFAEMILITFLKKDLIFFMRFFKYFLERVSMKDHKKLFYSFEFVLKKFLKDLMVMTKVAGLKFEVKGKISVTGNAKKRNKIIKYGRYSLTTKKLKIDYNFDIVRTPTGVLGLKMFMTY